MSEPLWVTEIWKSSSRPAASSMCCPDQKTSRSTPVRRRARHTGASLMISGRVPNATRIRMCLLKLSNRARKIIGKLVDCFRPDDRLSCKFRFAEIRLPGSKTSDHVNVEGYGPSHRYPAPLQHALDFAAGVA